MYHFDSRKDCVYETHVNDIKLYSVIFVLYNKIEIAIAIAIKWLPEATEISCVFGQEYNFDFKW